MAYTWFTKLIADIREAAKTPPTTKTTVTNCFNMERSKLILSHLLLLDSPLWTHLKGHLSLNNLEHVLKKKKRKQKTTLENGGKLATVAKHMPDSNATWEILTGMLGNCFKGEKRVCWKRVAVRKYCSL